MHDETLRERLGEASSLHEVEEILGKGSTIDAERVWQEIENRRSLGSEKLDLDELDSVSGGADRDWEKDGCAATCDWQSWCWSNDNCIVFDVTYSNFWRTCPDGHDHVFNDIKVCTRCGFSSPNYPDEP